MHTHTHTLTHTQICQAQTYTWRYYTARHTSTHTHKCTDTPGTDTAHKQAGPGHTGRQRCKGTHRLHSAGPDGELLSRPPLTPAGVSRQAGPRDLPVSVRELVSAITTQRRSPWGQGSRPSLHWRRRTPKPEKASSLEPRTHGRPTPSGSSPTWLSPSPTEIC